MTTQAMFQTKFTNLEFPKFSTGDPTTWLSKANQFFAYQDIPEDHHRVQLASYHLEDEAYQWWLAMTKTIKEDNTVITWNVFEGEMLVRFGSTEDFDEALCKIKQTGSLEDYLLEFERLLSKVNGWTQKALVGTFMGGLHTSISDSIRMFRPQSVKDVIMLARMRDEQLQKAKKSSANN
ncbi:unnamed protein product [Arabidopsis arenosa]|uniref:Retrotransposon gag domain-containing protein n=1 Tax=Arabidopsis arenosa TaxID=38785 RepID=A0A8S2AWT0_ARAAE|nr:unnamed protein product [Arabidopsis arenosa]